MKVVITGAGEVGYHVIGTMYREGVDIVVIDSDDAVLEQLKAEFNITTLRGNATDAAHLEKAGIADADLFLAITNFDETNIISCILAGQVSKAKKIARVKTIEMGEEATFTEIRRLGIDLIINPYEVAAEHLYNLVENPQATDHHPFMDGRVLLIRLPIGPESPLVNTTLREFGLKARIPQTLIAITQRNGESHIPAGDTVIREGDQVYFFCEAGQKDRLYTYLGQVRQPARRIFINGGGHIGYALAKRLERKYSDVRIMDISEERCEWLSDHLHNTLVLHMDGTDTAALASEGMDGVDTFLCVTNTDQVNIVSAMLAKELGARNTVALVKQPEMLPILENNELIDVAFSPRLLTARKILRFIRGEQLESFFSFVSSDIELLEIQAQAGTPCVAASLADLNLPKGLLVGAVQRGANIFIPRGNDQLEPGDRVLLLQQRRNRKVTNTLFFEQQEQPPPGTAMLGARSQA